MKSPTTISRCRLFLGTFVEITIADSRRSRKALESLADMAFGRIARIHSLVGSADPRSEISRLNLCGHLHFLPVHEWTREIVGEALRLARESRGVFDIAVASGGGAEKSPTRQKVNYEDVEIDKEGRIGFRQPLVLELDVAARGYAIDKAAEVLNEAGVLHGMIQAGGDICFIGQRPRAAALPQGGPCAVEYLRSEQGALAVATRAAHFTNRRRIEPGLSPILHPRTQKPMRSNVSVSVAARSCLDAGALSKVVLQDDPASWQSLLTKERASAVFLTSRGELTPFPVAV